MHREDVTSFNSDNIHNKQVLPQANKLSLTQRDTCIVLFTVWCFLFLTYLFTPTVVVQLLWSEQAKCQSP